MPRYVAFLRGVMPTNAKMPELKRCFEDAGFDDVKTILGSGNVVFTASKASEPALERRAEAAMAKRLGKAFSTIVRSQETLAAMLEADPFARYRLPSDAKRVVTFLRKTPDSSITLPPRTDGAAILTVSGREVFTFYVPGAANTPLFMTRIEKTFGKDVTTRTWDTVRKCAIA